MFYWLAGFADELSVFNVFRYITFRTGAALLTALLVVFLFGPRAIRSLRVRQGKGQPIRKDGPERHLLQKQGTPTMGGLMILGGVTEAALRVHRGEDFVALELEHSCERLGHALVVIDDEDRFAA